MTEPEQLLDFARQVEELGRSGLTQEQIAHRLGVALGTVKYRLGKLALVVTAGTAVIDAKTRRPLRELLDGGEFAFGDPEPAEVAA